jgi:hypothetical protein
MLLRWLSFCFVLAVISSGCEKNDIADPCLTGFFISDKTTRQQDDRTLAQLLQELSDISLSVPCSNTSGWSFLPYGTKACGGPLGYIPYHSSIDVDCFQKKVEHYTNLTKLYNSKHGVFSDCSLPPMPTGVVCDNGKPLLRY